MKRLIVASVVLLSVALSGCQDSKDEAQPLSEKDFYKTIGEEIPVETAIKWMVLYRKERSVQGRLEGTPFYSVSADHMKAALTSADDLVGVAFHHALDDNGERHILVIPVDATLGLWSDTPRMLLDANTNTEISADVASAWASNYKTAYPDEKWFHFFGKDVFDQMSALPYFSSVELEPAISELDFTPQLLLIVPNDEGESDEAETDASGRTSSLSLLYGAVYDASNSCPPCAVY